MTLATLTNRLMAEGTIVRERVNRYSIQRSIRARNLDLRVGTIVTLNQVHQIFAVQEGSDYRFRRLDERAEIPFVFRNPATSFTTHDAEFTTRRLFAESEPAPVLRRITRDSYHSHGDGIRRNGIEEALRAIPAESDGVRRSYGLEWEIYSLTEQQEDKLARLLDTLPRHFTERDGSLGTTGVEIIFLPLGRAKIKEVWNTMQRFCRENNICMDNTGAHLTYGIDDSEIHNVSDLQIRLNRVALAIKATSTQQAIKSVFGRDFTGYACLPNSTTSSGHSMSFSASRGTSAYELRLCNWQGDIEKITAMMDAIEFVFHRTFRAQDFMKIFEIMGANCSGI